MGPGCHALFWILKDSNAQLGLRASSLELAVDPIWNLKEWPSKEHFILVVSHVEQTVVDQLIRPGSCEFHANLCRSQECTS